MDPAGELAELAQRQIELAPGLLELLDRAGVIGELPLQGDQLQRERDEALLSPVVEVALEAAPLALSGLDDAGARLPQLLHPRTQLRLQAAVLERDAGR